MKLSIGILAHNESDSIAVLLNSLSQQSLFTCINSNHSIEVIIVPNGCTDDTAAIAHKTLEELNSNVNIAPLTGKVCEVEEAGKSNAWNLFIHQFSALWATLLWSCCCNQKYLDACWVTSRRWLFNQDDH